MNSSLRLLHTSDWHLGQYLMSRDRKREHERFLSWLLDCLRNQSIDVLLVCGDVFDTATPPNYALRLFFDFLHKISETPCRKVIILGGNHDSIATLHAPRKLLQLLDIHVVGGATARIEDEIVLVSGKEGEPAAIVCAVPFLRDRDLRHSVAGETYAEKSRALLHGVRMHYRMVMEAAERLRAGLPGQFNHIPIIATGHLFVAGGLASDGVRELYVGSLGEIDSGSFPAFDYIALGHLHRAQTIKGRLHYSGSPIPLSFSEADGVKQVKIVTFSPDSSAPQISALAVPSFQKLGVVRGDIEQIRSRLAEIGADGADDEKVWVEVQVTGESSVFDLQGAVSEAAEGLPVEILAVRRVKGEAQPGPGRGVVMESLNELLPRDVFARRLAMEKDLSAMDAEELARTFHEALQIFHEGGEGL
ncbi:MAG: exonuclease SbcCD subunit D C-terminal domain-containing protein [Pseudomonadota bacterium]